MMTNPDALFARVRSRLDELGVGLRVLVAYSGGLDSSALVDLLDRLYRRGGPTVELIHIDHGLRDDSGDHARFCRTVARRRGLPITVVELNLDANAGQAAARNARMAAIARHAIGRGIDDVLFGHHGDDRIESFLFNLRRGTGLDGLAPILPADDFPIPGTNLRTVRPLLDFTRAELETYVRHRGVEFVEDPTNATDDYARNRIRHHLVDELAESPKMRRRILRAIDHLHDERSAADAHADELAEGAAISSPGIHRKTFRRDVLADAPAATAARLFQQRMPSLDADALDRIAQAIRKEHTAPKVLTLTGCVVTVVRNRVVFERSFQRGGRDVLQRCALPLSISPFDGGWAPFFGGMVRWSSVSDPGGDDEPRVNCWTALFDADELALPLTVSGFTPGARLPRQRADGSVYHQKLTKIFSEFQVDADVRWRWPCLYDGEGELVWAAGLRRGAAARVLPRTSQMWRLSVVPADELTVILQH